MPKKARVRKPGWTIYGVTEQSRAIIRLLAAKEYIGQGDAVDVIVKEWYEMKEKNNQ